MVLAIENEAMFRSEVLESDKPVLVDFFATWCGPCRMVSPIVDEIAEERADTLKVVKVDVDEVPSVAAAYGVMSIPTLMVFRGGETVNTQVGAMPKARIEAML
ncbi:MAG: thioredoxin [Oscillospiraceae bacterium]|nr:thioredoxin [Oscillospiraceae bacterium]MBQ2158232.1 thioredoxin [Oscillospiraceae bacterium]MBQ2329584.1 thioredoxin [Oscillospiraceae bacterium]MBQ3986600.1 thioredoxin [Oscillospiraceae bacterium]MBQ5503906.1 thioredoxin [Oscillospiraceae bacterium]